MKEYISTIIYVCIFSIILELILPENKLKKYIGVLIGIIILLSLISPITYGIEDKIVATISEVTNSVEFESKNNSIDFSQLENKMVLLNVQRDLEARMFNDLNEDVCEVTSVEIKINNKYEIERIIVRAKNVNEVVSAYSITEYLSNTYNINNTLIDVIKEE